MLPLLPKGEQLTPPKSLILAPHLKQLAIDREGEPLPKNRLRGDREHKFLDFELQQIIKIPREMSSLLERSLRCCYAVAAIKAGTAPKRGPKKGIRLVKPAITPKPKANSDKPKIPKPKLIATPKIAETKILPWR